MTADPSAALGMTKGEGCASIKSICRTGKQQVPPLRYPGFPVELGGVGALHAAFLNEGSTRGSVQRSVTGNPGPVGMTNLLCHEPKPRRKTCFLATNLSSRPERSVVEGPAFSFSRVLTQPV